MYILLQCSTRMYEQVFNKRRKKKEAFIYRVALSSQSKATLQNMYRIYFERRSDIGRLHDTRANFHPNRLKAVAHERKGVEEDY